MRGERRTVRTVWGLITWTALVLGVPMSAAGSELSTGVSLGGFQAGTVPRLAVSPHVGMLWRVKSDFLFAVHDLCSILPPNNSTGIDVFNETSVVVGYTSKNAYYSAGPSLSLYSMTACGLTLCGRVVGVAPGVHAQTDIYFTGPLGVSVSANVDWVGGSSRVLPGGVAVMIVAGPVFRWSAK